MRITMFSINPLFPGHVMGGAPKHLQNIAIHMGERGHKVTILCTQAKDNYTPFKWHENVTVLPVLPFKQPFPQPYDIPAYQFASVLQQVGNHLHTADRFYMHDGEFLFPFASAHIPTVVSLRDNVYPETIHGGFLFNGHKLILISDYSRQYYLHTAGRFYAEYDDRIEIIHNGLDWERFTYTEPDKILEYIPFDPKQHTVILHPHRPEPSKGIMQTIAVTDLLVNQYGFTDIKTLIPKWHDVQTSSDLQAFYDSVQHEIHTRNLQEHIALHSWIPQELMPEYFSMGAVTLSLGHFVESFGNAVYESLGCGTPSIAARISTHRELLPDNLLDKVDFDDAGTTARIAADIIREKRRTSPETMAYLHKHYGIKRQLNHYARVIENAQVSRPMTYRQPILTDETPYILAPWCYINSAGKVYHDFRADYADLGTLGDFLQSSDTGISITQATQSNIPRETFTRAYHDGYIVPRIFD